MFLILKLCPTPNHPKAGGEYSNRHSANNLPVKGRLENHVLVVPIPSHETPLGSSGCRS